ncbi:MAG TPA: 16S rRNA (cytidine(1402)-2'-O)-methyltransferase [Casimicrobiaceae bacterium]|nr:16S rRNA (cytidine(1402)-2'-O)-methyltransferase [Casimicrobiaceae bacterium]
MSVARTTGLTVVEGGNGASGDEGAIGAEGSGCGAIVGGRRAGSASVGFGTAGATGHGLVGAPCAAQNAFAPNKPSIATKHNARRRPPMRAKDEAVTGKKKRPSQETRVAATGAPSGSLYVVATPLGALDDVTVRARDTLASVDRILAEDTRVTSALLAHCGIAARATALHAWNEMQRIDDVLRGLRAGESIALVTDAGTPAISDPGARLCRAAHEGGFRVVPVPGPCAATAAVSAAGLVAERFLFLGFLPVKVGARAELLQAIGSLPFALVIYEAPHRVRSTVEALAGLLDGDRWLVVCRELTKRFEEIARLPLRDALRWLDADVNRERGEFVLVVDATVERVAVPIALDVGSERWLRALLAELAPSAAARIVSAVSGVPRATVYDRALELKRSSE